MQILVCSMVVIDLLLNEIIIVLNGGGAIASRYWYYITTLFALCFVRSLVCRSFNVWQCQVSCSSEI